MKQQHDAATVKQQQEPALQASNTSWQHEAGTEDKQKNQQLHGRPIHLQLLPANVKHWQADKPSQDMRIEPPVAAVATTSVKAALSFWQHRTMQLADTEDKA